MKKDKLPRLESLAIDLADTCNLHCRNCYRGNGVMKNTGVRMSLELYEKILDKTRREGVIKWIALFNWSEPFVIQNLIDYVKMARSFGFRCALSTNLSIPHIPNLLETLEAGVDALLITVSGFDNEIHRRNHRNSDIGVVLRHLETIHAARKQGRLANVERLSLKFLNFGYNTGQIDEFRKLFDGAGVRFEDIKGQRNPPHGLFGLKRGVGNAAASYIFPKTCKNIYANIPLDAMGHVFLCCCRPNFREEMIGDYLKMSLAEIMVRRINHPSCSAGSICKIATMPYNMDSAKWVFAAHDYFMDTHSLGLKPVFPLFPLASQKSASGLSRIVQAITGRQKKQMPIKLPVPHGDGVFLRVKKLPDLPDIVKLDQVYSGSYINIDGTTKVISFHQDDDGTAWAVIPEAAADGVVTISGRNIKTQAASMIIEAFVPSLGEPAGFDIIDKLEIFEPGRISGWAYVAGDDAKVAISLVNKSGAAAHSRLADAYCAELADLPSKGYHGYHFEGDLSDIIRIEFSLPGHENAYKVFFRGSDEHLNV